MALILHIDTALETASVGISDNGKPLAFVENTTQNTHARFVQSSIKEILTKTDIHIADLSAIGVIAGPGSYTGLRIGMASAKGLCYSHDKPLLCISTLDMIVKATAAMFTDFDYYCPLIDARRNEVYTALYDRTIVPTISPCAMILNSTSFEQYSTKGKILFTGNAVNKCEQILNASDNFFFKHLLYNGETIASEFYKSFINKDFRDLAYTEPIYLKEFYNTKS